MVRLEKRDRYWVHLANNGRALRDLPCNWTTPPKVSQGTMSGKYIQSLLLWTRQGLPIQLLRFGIEKKLDTNDDDRERPDDFENR